ncbi:MAG: DUF4231 domain-containing protein, partial [Merismopedia sp. SIO2A8]|nr:DUF4231 domain-containing protein [Merismopedia sp. SIO2A8]
SCGSHSDGYTVFAERVEQYIQQDVKGFLAQLSERQEGSKEKTKDEIDSNAQFALDNLNRQLEIRAQQIQKLEEERQQLAEESAQVKAVAQSSGSGGTSQALMSTGTDGNPPSSNSEALPPGLPTNLPTSLPPLGASALPWTDDLDDLHKAAETRDLNGKGEASLTADSTATALSNGANVTQSTRSATLLTKVPQLVQADEVAEIVRSPLSDCETYLPGILVALHEYAILDKQVLIGILATVRVETGGFKPVHEWGGESYWKQYEGRQDLGNVNSGDGIKYHGRGYIHSIDGTS